MASGQSGRDDGSPQFEILVEQFQRKKDDELDLQPEHWKQRQHHFGRRAVIRYLAVLLVSLPGACLAAAPPCASWPTNMALVHLKNAGLADLTKIDESKTKAVRLASEKVGKSIVRVHEIGEAGIVLIGTALVRGGKVPIEVVLRPLRTRRVDLTSVETPALLGIRKQIVSAGDFLEFLFGRLVAGIEIRVQFLR